MLLNLRLSTSEFIRLLSEEHSSKDEIRETAKCYKHNPQLGSYFRWQILQAAIVKGIRLYAGLGLLGLDFRP